MNTIETNTATTRGIMRVPLEAEYNVQSFQKQHAFIIGINDYQYVSKLKTAVNDAVRLGEILKDNHFHTVHPICINPNADTLRGFLANMKNVVGEHDSAVLYFAGHGIALEDDKGMSGYIVPTDAQVNDGKTLIPMSFVQDCCEALPCRHFLMILDCCFAGSIRWATTQRDVDTLFLPKRIYKERFERYLTDNAWQVLASAGHDQKAFDSLKGLQNQRDADGEHSPFALALFDALSGKGDIVPADGGDGIITATEMYLYLREQVELPTVALNMRLRQTPAIFTLPKHDKGEFIFFAPNHRLNLSPIPKNNPFMGLKSFSEEEKERFYGRDRVIQQLLQRVETQKLTVVSGASGTGKSSVVKAGLIPQLREKNYNVLPVIRPTQKPLDVISHVAFEDKEKPVLVIDQFEELLTQSTDEDREKFLQILRGYVADGLKVVVTVRSDFEPQFDTDWADWHNGRFVVPPFTVDEWREVIVRPTVQAVLQFDKPQLIDQILQEVVQSPGALPLLSFTLSELYEKYVTSSRNDRLLTEKDYNALGGVIGSLRKKADKVYTELDTPHQDAMRNMMLRLVSIGGGDYAGKRVFKTNLIFEDAAETKRVETVRCLMEDARLIAAGTDSEGRAYIEPAHDALVRAWTKLTEWVKARGEENVLLQNKLAEAVDDYSNLNNIEVLWHDDPRLDILRGSKNTWMNKRESQFIADSIAEKEKRRKKRRRELVIAFSILSALLIGAVYFAITSNENAKIASANAIKAQLNADTAKTNEIKAVNNLKLYKLQEVEKLFTDADTYKKSGHFGYAKGALDSIESLKKEYFKDSTALQNQIDVLRQTLK